MVKIKDIINHQQQAIEVLKLYDPNCPMIEETNFIIEALEKQIAKKVKTHIDKVTTKYICPNCGRLYWEKSHIGNCCDMCGQRLMV